MLNICVLRHIRVRSLVEGLAEAGLLLYIPLRSKTKLYKTIENMLHVSALVVCVTGEVGTMAADRRSACSHLGKPSVENPEKLDTDGVETQLTIVGSHGNCTH